MTGQTPTQEVIEEASTWGVGLGMLIMVLAPLSIPFLALTAVALIPLVLPLVALALVVALVAAPILLFRRLGRWMIKRSRSASTVPTRPVSSRSASG
jgi:hypothetical protein